MSKRKIQFQRSSSLDVKYPNNFLVILAFLLVTTATSQSVTTTTPNTDIYFPGRTNTNTNSVHNVVADRNRNNVLNFLGQPFQVDLPPTPMNPFVLDSNVVNGNTNGQGFQNQNSHGHHNNNNRPVQQQQPNLIRPNSDPQRGAVGGGSPSSGAATISNSVQNPTFGQVPPPPTNSVLNVQQAFFTPPKPPQSRPTEGRRPQPELAGPNPYVTFAFELFAVRRRPSSCYFGDQTK